MGKAGAKQGQKQSSLCVRRCIQIQFHSGAVGILIGRHAGDFGAGQHGCGPKGKNAAKQ